jgi:hypothetical protein
MYAVKEGQHKYCETLYSRSGINHRIQTQNLKIINTIGEGADAYPSRVSNVLPSYYWVRVA